MREFVAGYFVGAVITLVLCFYLVIVPKDGHYKRAHCQPIETRVEYDKCFKEFGATK